jgi:tetrahydromethanopterin S-methyltransferase subunit G
MWMTAQGDSGKIDKAKGILKGAVIGLIIIFSAYSIAFFVIASLSEATTGYEYIQ